MVNGRLPRLGTFGGVTFHERQHTVDTGRRVYARFIIGLRLPGREKPANPPDHSAVLVSLRLFQEQDTPECLGRRGYHWLPTCIPGSF